MTDCRGIPQSVRMRAISFEFQVSPASSPSADHSASELATSGLNRKHAKAGRHPLFSTITPFASLASWRFKFAVGDSSFGNGNRRASCPGDIIGRAAWIPLLSSLQSIRSRRQAEMPILPCSGQVASVTATSRDAYPVPVMRNSCAFDWLARPRGRPPGHP
jgi:hypothetical protein